MHIDVVRRVLRKVPDTIRWWLLIGFATFVVFTQIIDIFGYSIASEFYQVLALFGAYLGIQSAANVDPDTEREDFWTEL